MKKSINITLNGLVFSLEEDAYEKLKDYLDSIKAYYKGMEEEEILADIESSIAEKFNQKLKSVKQAITLVDVEEVIKVMGTVEEITESEDENEEKGEKGNQEPTTKKRLYRGSDDVVIAGVASGIASYLGVDPVFVRIIFVILAFANGIGILAYLVFWIAVPKAETNSQKLEMRGKPVNLAEIEQAVKEKSRIIGQEGKKAIGRLQNSGIIGEIFNIPVRIIEIAFNFIKKIFKILFPAVLIIIGIGMLVGSVLAIIGLSIGSSVMVFNINSPYLISDLPLNEIASSPVYYIAVISLYAVCAIPMIFLSALGITMIRRKNSYNSVISSILVGVWMLAIVISTVAAFDLVPMVKARIDEISTQETVSRNYDYKDFNKLYLSGVQNITVKKGDEFSINLHGRQSDIDRLQFEIEEGQLQITQKAKKSKGVCIFCFDNKVTGEVTMPSLDSFVGIGRTRTVLSGFENDIYISLGETARAELEAHGQNITGALSGVDSNLKIQGDVNIIEMKMNGSADLTASELSATSVKMTMGVFSSAQLDGEVKTLKINMDGNTRLVAKELLADEVYIEAGGFSDANILVNEKLEASSTDNASIAYRGNPKDTVKNVSGRGRIVLLGDNERTSDRVENEFEISTDIKEYSPLMSSARGIGMLANSVNIRGGNLVYRWKTSQGVLTDDFEERSYAQEIETDEADQKVYWTYPLEPNMIDNKESIYVYLEVFSEVQEELVGSARIELVADDSGMVTVVEAE